MPDLCDCHHFTCTSKHQNSILSTQGGPYIVFYNILAPNRIFQPDGHYAPADIADIWGGGAAIIIMAYQIPYAIVNMAFQIPYAIVSMAYQIPYAIVSMAYKNRYEMLSMAYQIPYAMLSMAYQIPHIIVSMACQIPYEMLSNRRRPIICAGQ